MTQDASAENVVFELKLPHSELVAHGALLPEHGPSGSQRFVVRAGAPVRRELMASFPQRPLRQQMIDEGAIRPSSRWPGMLETTRDLVFPSPTAAAEMIVGRAASGLSEWRTESGRELRDFLSVSPGPRRTWLVRGVPAPDGPAPDDRLPDGPVRLAAGRLRPGIEPGTSRADLQRFVDEDFDATASAGQLRQLADAIFAFLTRMRPGDTVCTLVADQLFIGEILGPPEEVTPPGGRPELRRPVEWQRGGYPVADVPERLQQMLSIPQDVVDLTAAEGLIAALGRSTEELRDAGETDGVQTAAVVALRELTLPQPTPEFADRLLVHDVGWLRELRDLLWDDRQIVLYGPPGTGKTHLALELAEFLSGGRERVTLVQFHPSYSYEDFFQGFRPVEDPVTREVAFRLTDGPLRELADVASRESNRHVPHFLVIDEINRANLAKVFGELYFLLEYRDRSVRLTYSDTPFALPPNLFVIGTMNTADRSIALVDAAMRRRFAFVELSPRVEPTRGLLRRWLARQGRSPETADLLDELNRRIGASDFRIGPSYLMKPGTARPGGLERTWRTKILPLLEEHHYGEDVDVDAVYGLDAVRAGVARDDR